MVSEITCHKCQEVIGTLIGYRDIDTIACPIHGAHGKITVSNTREVFDRKGVLKGFVKI